MAAGGGTGGGSDDVNNLNVTRTSIGVPYWDSEGFNPEQTLNNSSGDGSTSVGATFLQSGMGTIREGTVEDMSESAHSIPRLLSPGNFQGTGANFNNAMASSEGRPEYRRGFKKKMYVKYRSRFDAQKVFDQIPKLDAVSWTA